MIKPSTSLFSKILFWLFLNLAILQLMLIIASAFFHNNVILHMIMGMQNADRMQNTFTLVSQDLGRVQHSEWSDELSRFADIYDVDLTLIFESGATFSSTEIPPSSSVMTRVRQTIEQNRAIKQDQATGEENSFAIEREPNTPNMMMRTQDPVLYWTGFIVELPPDEISPPTPAMLLAVSDSAIGRGFLFDPIPWMLIIITIIVISVLLWIPVSRHITSPLAHMTLLTEEIAKGRFDISLTETRDDEIGRLAKATNHMSSQLSALLQGQKRFLGDIAHELGSPVARIQFGLAALEQRIEGNNQERVKGVMEDVEQLSILVNELLTFSQADMQSKTVQLESTELLPIIQEAVRREILPGSLSRVTIQVKSGIHIVASTELITRAISNLLRNSVKYAGENGLISISARKKHDIVVLEIVDNGPGVVEEYVARLFEPFFRPDPSRDRESGGVGLGLAIVKTCVETCQGTVSARNLTPTGFAVTITLIA